MTKRRNSPTERGTRTEADYAAAAEWAETTIPDLADQPKNSGEASREAARAMLDRALDADAAPDTPVEAYARALLHRGRPSLSRTGTQHCEHEGNRGRDLSDGAACRHTTPFTAKTAPVLTRARQQPGMPAKTRRVPRGGRLQELSSWCARWCDTCRTVPISRTVRPAAFIASAA